jgi:branched-chain amino acid aminotransferase
MQPTKYIWLNGSFVPWNEAKIHVLTHALHYGTGVFEGIRLYATKKGPAIFQLDKHLDRMYYGARCLDMNVPWSQAEFKEAILETVRRNEVTSSYIRPIFYYGFAELRVDPGGCPVDGAIAVWPWGAYLGDEAINVIVSDVIRIHPKSTFADAKITGHYVNSMLAGFAVRKGNYQEALLLDFEGNIAEGPGENFFIVRGNTLITPPLYSILAGITRTSVFELARDLGYVVEEKKITLNDALQADECFFTGTAAEVTAIKSINDQPMKNQNGPVTARLRDEFRKIVNGENHTYEKWLTFV